MVSDALHHDGQAPLSAPLVLRQSHSTLPSESLQPWRRERTSYWSAAAKTSLDHTSGAGASYSSSSAPARSKLEPSQIQDALDEWGVPSPQPTDTHAQHNHDPATNASSSSPNAATTSANADAAGRSRLPTPTCAVSWEENSIEASCSYLSQSASSSDLDIPHPFSLDYWDTSISYAPFAASALAPIDTRTTNAQLSAAQALENYNPSLGRVLAVGRQDGTVSVYRALGRLEDHLGLPDASPDISHSLTSPTHSARSSIIASPTKLRSPDLELSSINLSSAPPAGGGSLSSRRTHATALLGREPSPLLSTFSHDRSFGSIPGRSTVSAASVHSHSTVAVNVQVEEGHPVDSIESNITATGTSSTSTNSRAAEHQLEAQMAAAERNDHQHGIVGGVIEKLGLAPQHTHQHSSRHSAGASPRGGVSIPASPTVERNRTNPASSSSSSSLSLSKMAANHLTSLDSAARPSAVPMSSAKSSAGNSVHRPNDTATASHIPSVDRATLPSIFQQWPLQPKRGRFEHLFTLAGRDRSPVVAVRLLPIPSTGASTSSSRSQSVGLLVVQEEGTVALWSLKEGSVIWQLDLSNKFPDHAADELPTDPLEFSTTSAEAPSLAKAASRLDGALPKHIQSLSLPPSSRSATPLNRSPAGSIRSGKPGGRLAKTAVANAAFAAKSDRHEELLAEVLGVSMSSSVQLVRYGATDLAMLWDSFDSVCYIIDPRHGRMLSSEQIRNVYPGSVPALRHTTSLGLHLIHVGRDKAVHPHKIDLPGLASSDGDDDVKPVWTLPEDLDLDRVLVSQNQLLAITTAGELHSFQLDTGAESASRRLTGPESIQALLALTRPPHQHQDELLVKTIRGLATISMADVPESQPTLTSYIPPQARLHLPWATPDTSIPSKVFLLSATRGSEHSTQAPSDVELGLWDMSTQTLEDLERDPEQDDELADTLLPPSKVGHDDSTPATDRSRVPRVTAMLPMSLERVAVAVQGGLKMLSLASLSLSTQPIVLDKDNSIGVDRDVCLLRLAVAPRSGTRYIVGGTRHGEVAFWDATSLELLGCQSISTSPVEALVTFGDEDNAIRLHGCVACVAADSSISVLVLEDLKRLYTLPGRGARLQAIAVRADEILLTYDDHKARLWDLRTQELRRSIAVDDALALIHDAKGWWSIKFIHPYSPLHSGTTGVLSQLAAARSSFSAALLVDFRRAIEAAARAVGASGSTRTGTSGRAGARPDATAEASAAPTTAVEEEEEAAQAVSIGSPAARKAVGIVRPLLPVVFPMGLDAQMDRKLSVLLNLDLEDGSLLDSSRFSVGLQSAPEALLVPGEASQGDNDDRAGSAGSSVSTRAASGWKLSSRLTTVRTLICSVLLRVLSRIEELHAVAVELQRFVETDVGARVGEGFAEVSMADVAEYLLDSNEELQLASRTLLQVALARLDESGLEALCDRYQPLLPVNLPSTSGITGATGTALKSSKGASTALLLLGTVAVERYKWMSPRLLKDIAASIGQMMADETNSAHRAVAIELCRTGFSIWQHYFDATEMVRWLFALSTNNKDSTPGSGGGGGGGGGVDRGGKHAAVYDDAEPGHPACTVGRALRSDDATGCISGAKATAGAAAEPATFGGGGGQVARSDSDRDAGGGGERSDGDDRGAGGDRLAVGTHEGAVIMYDLKTATRLYVIEGHRRPISGCSFSPDGRRLVTLSLEEGKLLIWKVGGGLSSFFTPGSMPRQGGGTDSSGAYRAILFNVGDEAAGPPPPPIATPASNPSAAVTTRATTTETSPSQSQSQSQSQSRKTEEEKTLLNTVAFEWHTDRGVGVKIGQAQLNLSVD
ncbi:hypothetical protein BCV70DRAFT_229024 [Testicularia cyperi]|uniref:Uncharacterized protein n=1 Tax=Testicularia cyperi TaxID=1882483 RepID=A0A317XZ29_9BASI|nr:hypothetical protein BCV70DRAFT_229024 [Testicularia cyperi]